MLHVTNGDIAADLIRNAGLAGKVLPWRDVLHEGPLPGGVPLEEMSEVRAHFLASPSWGSSFEEVRRQFRERDATLRAGLSEDEIVLWFEADLYDQLQILQVLDWIGRHLHPAVSIICIGDFPGVPGFRGLGQLTSSQLASLFPGRRAVQGSQLDLARRAWSAITAPTPEPLNQLRRADTAALEFLGAALIRLLEHYPSVVNGVDRTESQILRVISQGNRRFEAIFPAVQELEERPFMGDSTLWSRVLGLARGKVPALTIGSGVDPSIECMWPPRAEMGLTDFGRQCLDGKADYLAVNAIDRWVGGVHLAPGAPWRWDPVARRVGKYPTEVDT